MTNEIKVIRYYSMENQAYYLKVTNNDKFVATFMSDEIVRASEFAHQMADKIKQKLEEETILTITI